MISELNTMSAEEINPPNDVKVVLRSDSKKISVDSGIGGKIEGDIQDVESSGTSPGEDEVDCFEKTKESRTLQTFYGRLMIAMEPEIFSLTSELFSADLIGNETKNKALDSGHLSNGEKCACVLKDIECNVMLRPPVLLDFVHFLSNTGSNALSNLSKEMKERLDAPNPPEHSMSDSPLEQKRTPCIHNFRSDPAIFHGLTTMCEHCEFHYRALSATFDKFCTQYLFSSLRMSGVDVDSIESRVDVNQTNDCDKNSDCNHVPNEANCLTENRLEVTTTYTSQSTAPVMPLAKPSSNPEELSPDLFQAQTSISRQFSVDSVCSATSEAYLEEITGDFLGKLKTYHRKQKESEKKVINEKAIVSEKLSRTEQGFMELSRQKSESEEQLATAQEKISQLEQSLQSAWMNNGQLNREILKYKRQLKNEKCASGDSIHCKHYTRCAELEDDKDKLKKHVERSESDAVSLKSKIENLERQVSMLLEEKSLGSLGSLVSF